MMDSILYIILVGVLAIVAFMGVWWVNKRAYKKAKNEIFDYVKSYKRLCTENNRFIVTPSELQNAFREYDILLINRVFQELINEKIISQDPMDQEWSVR